MCLGFSSIWTWIVAESSFTSSVTPLICFPCTLHSRSNVSEKAELDASTAKRKIGRIRLLRFSIWIIHHLPQVPVPRTRNPSSAHRSHEPLSCASSVLQNRVHSTRCHGVLKRTACVRPLHQPELVGFERPDELKRQHRWFPPMDPTFDETLYAIAHHLVRALRKGFKVFHSRCN